MDLKAYKEYSIFDGLDITEIKLFIDKAHTVNVTKGDTFIVEGEVGDSIFLLLKGEVEVNQALTLSMNKSEADNREKAITKLSSDYKLFFGEMSLFNDGDRRTASVKALTNCTLSKIGKDELFEICNEHPETGYKVMQNLCRTLCRNLVKANQNVLKLTTAFSLILER
ncbi:MAG: cyclic nucleotide-binding domain-containing protein [Fidelibacterota bacterium]